MYDVCERRLYVSVKVTCVYTMSVRMMVTCCVFAYVMTVLRFVCVCMCNGHV